MKDLENGIELNGLANIKILSDEIKLYTGDHRVSKAVDAIQGQLVFLERYMLAVATRSDGFKKGLEFFQGMGTSDSGLPHWHDILQNPQKFPTRKERRK